jgi:hypothetical protein
MLLPTQTSRVSLLTASSVEQSVACLYRVVDCVGADGIVDLPETEADLGHLMATVELDGRARHFDGLLVFLDSFGRDR